MQITVFGASGNVGRLVVEDLLAKEHQPVVFVHSHNPFEGNPLIKAVQGDIYVADDVKRSLQGSHAVISTLGSWGTQHKDVLSSAMASIIPAMDELRINRIVSLTGADAHDSTDKSSLLQKLSQAVSGIFLGKIVCDGTEHIRLLRASQLAWTVVRSPAMNNLGSNKYALHLRWAWPVRTIKRQAVAASLVDQLEDKTFWQQSPTIFRH